MNMSTNMCCSFLSYINIIGQVHVVGFKRIRRIKSKSIEINQPRNSTAKQVSALYLFNNIVNIAHIWCDESV